MSENKAPVGGNEPSGEGSDEVVPKKIYDKAAQDMLAYKAKMRDLEGKLAELSQKQQEDEILKLKESEKWKDLWQKSEESKKAIESKSKVLQEKLEQGIKLQAFQQVSGGFKKPEFNRFVDTSKIQILEDGTVDMDSVKAVYDYVKTEYSDLLVGTSVKPLPAQAPVNGKQDSMTPEQIADYKSKLAQDLFKR